VVVEKKLLIYGVSWCNCKDMCDFFKSRSLMNRGFTIRPVITVAGGRLWPIPGSFFLEMFDSHLSQRQEFSLDLSSPASKVQSLVKAKYRVIPQTPLQLLQL
jgi:hypothetical protein